MIKRLAFALLLLAPAALAADDPRLAVCREQLRRENAWVQDVAAAYEARLAEMQAEIDKLKAGAAKDPPKK